MTAAGADGVTRCSQAATGVGGGSPRQRRAAAEAKVSPDDLDLIRTCDDVDEAMEHIRDVLTRRVPGTDPAQLAHVRPGKSDAP